MKRITMLLFVLVLLSCTRDKNPAGPSDSDFGFYFLKDESVTIYNFQDEGADLTPQETPWLSAKDIDFYDFSSHCIYLKKPKTELFPDYDDSFQLMQAMSNKMFWIIANGKQCYLAAFHGAASSLACFTPFVNELSFDFYPSDVLPLQGSWLGDDERNNQTVKNALKAAGLYHAGLTVELQDVNVTDNSDIATVQYILKITNNDVDDLLVLDADKMGSGLFHYFTIGPMIYNEDRQLHYYAEHREFTKPAEGVTFDPEWFTVIKSGQSKSWTITLEGYDTIQPGQYKCEVKFASPMEIDLAHRYVGKARYWLGEIETPTITIEL
jgi:hypothetical protein